MVCGQFRTAQVPPIAACKLGRLGQKGLRLSDSSRCNNAFQRRAVEREVEGSLPDLKPWPIAIPICFLVLPTGNQTRARDFANGGPAAILTTPPAVVASGKSHPALRDPPTIAKARLASRAGRPRIRPLRRGAASPAIGRDVAAGQPSKLAGSGVRACSAPNLFLITCSSAPD